MKDVITEIPLKIQELVNKFKENQERYEKTDYNETQARIEFIDPFFKELGWDIDNTSGNAESYKDVIHEDKIKIGGNSKSPDYSFRIGGQRKFFVEAKKPSVDLKNSKDAVFQLRRYGWTARLTFCILTDFQEFAVYQTNNIKPYKFDNPSVARVFYCKFDELDKPCLLYPEFKTNWDFIAGTFTKEAILKGRFDKFSDKKKKFQQTFDEEFLKFIQECRKDLAENIVLRNRNILFEKNEIEILKEQHLNEVVRKTIDRLIFLRIAEDRGIEKYEQLLEITKKKDIYISLLNIFNIANQKYNAGLFDDINDISREIQIDDKILKKIIDELYETYDFQYVPLDILGQIYETFLGDKIILEDRKPKIETKPEVRKAGGVFYTPEYIIDYIVENTIGEALKTKNLKNIKDFTICDPSCGSGAFLIVAYEYIMKWYILEYKKINNKKFIYENEKGHTSLILGERKRILKDHIFGVDIDKQAVEVAKLSLLLKCLEGVNKDNIDNHNKLFHERALPNIDSNIKCGNSLIGTDYKTGELFDLEEQIIVNAFDWKEEFKQIFINRGFDCIIGNPPYVRLQTLGIQKGQVEYFKKNYLSSQKGNYDIYVLFIEKSFKLLKENGINGFILPHKFTNADYGQGIRNFIWIHRALKKIIHFGDLQVFNQATTYICLLFLQKNSQELDFAKIKNIEEFQKRKFEILTSDNNFYDKSNWYFQDINKIKLIEKIKQNAKPLGEIASIFQGLVTSADKVFLLDFISENKNTYIVNSKITNQEFEIEKKFIKPVLKGSEIKAYNISKPQNVILFPYEKGELVSFEKIEKLPKTYEYLMKNKELLESREDGKFEASWWQFGRNQNIDKMNKEKIVLSVLANKSAFAFDSTGEYCFVGGGNAGGYGVIIKNLEYSYLYVLALLNSKLLDFCVKQVSTEFRGGYVSYAKRFIESLSISLATPEIQEKLSKLVQQMIDMNKRLEFAKTSEQTILERQIKATDNLINKMVYKLYELTAEEIEIIESFVQK